MPQQMAGLRRKARCGALIPRLWITGQRGVGVTRPYQQEGERCHTLPQEKHGKPRERAECVRWVVSVRAGDTIRRGVDGGGGSGIGI